MPLFLLYYRSATGGAHARCRSESGRVAFRVPSWAGKSGFHFMVCWGGRRSRYAHGIAGHGAAHRSRVHASHERHGVSMQPHAVNVMDDRLASGGAPSWQGQVSKREAGRTARWRWSAPPQRRQGRSLLPWPAEPYHKRQATFRCHRYANAAWRHRQAPIGPAEWGADLCWCSCLIAY